MSRNDISRRSFFATAGMAGLTLGALGSIGALGNEKTAFADEAAASGSTALSENEYLNIFGDETGHIPVRKAEWTKLSGPIGFESRAIDASEIARTDTCDFLVIGCGISGMMAMLKAAEEGASVIGIEKMAQGRNSWESVGGFNTKLQQEANNVPDPAEYVEAIMRASDWRARADVVWGFVNQSGEAVDFFSDMLAKAGKGVTLRSTQQPPSPYGVDVIQAEHKITLPEDVEWNTWLTGPAAFDSLLTTAATYSNLDIRYNTAGVQLTHDDAGRVTGAIAKDAEGYYAIEASKGVLLATGGYEANPQMMQALIRPEEFHNACVYAPGTGPTGDGHMMGLAVGAQMEPTPHTVMSFRSGLPDAPLDSSSVSACFPTSIWVNHQGRRFINESLPHNFVANAINTQGASGKNVWFLFDSAVVSKTAESTPDLLEDIEACKEKGWLVEGATIAELAEAMEVDPAELEKTISTFNGYFDAETPQDLEFRRQMEKAVPIKEGPFYACVHVSKILVTVSGLIINDHAQVLDGNEKVIEGLYAAGNASGGMFAVSYPRHLPSTSVGRCVTYGYVAAKHALKGE